MDLLDLLRSYSKYDIVDEIINKNVSVKIPKDILEKIIDINEDDLNNLNKQYNIKIIPEDKLSKITMKGDKYKIIECDITCLYKLKPYPVEYSYVCNECKRKYAVKIQNPITNMINDTYTCTNENCLKSYRFPITPEIKFDDLLQINISDDSNECIAYFYTSDSDYNKLLLASNTNSKIKLYGFINSSKTTNKYYMNIYHYEILNSSNKNKNILHIFSLQSEPNTEKQMIYSNFFSNYEFMKRFLDFDTYEIKEQYPDLVIYKNGNPTFIEFEYDVSNFYNHKHHLSPQKVEYVIAWKNTSIRKNHDFQIILLPELDNMILTYNNYESDYNYFNDLFNLVCCIFSHRSPKSLYPVVLHLLSTNNQVRNIYNIEECFLMNITNWNKKDEESYIILTKIFGSLKKNIIQIKKPKKEKIDINISLEDSITDQNINSDIMNKIEEIKTHYYYYKSSSFSLIYEQGLLSKLYNECSDLNYINQLLYFVSYVNKYNRKHTITYDDITFINNMIHSMTIT